MKTRPSKRKSVSDQHAMTSTEAMIDMHGIVKKFKNAAGEFTVLKGVDLTINKGEFVSIVGKSGMVNTSDHVEQCRFATP